MKNHQLLISFALVAVLAGCAAKEKAGEEVTANGERIGTESMDFDAMGSDSGRISGLATVFFDFDQSTLNAAEQKKLFLNAMWLQNNPDKKMVVEGHADQNGSNEYNLSLGERRANYVKARLIKLGVKSSRLTVVSFGEEKPLIAGDSDAAMAKNRRANFVPQ